MEVDTLQDRLSSNAKAFDGLLSLIPSKLYYGEDTSEQWKKKKQSKAEAKAARRGKLDPNSARNRNAKEVMDERANKRKLDEMSDDDSHGSVAESLDGVDKEQPGEGLQRHEDDVPSKKQKLSKAKQAKKVEKRMKREETKMEKRKAEEAQKTEMSNGTGETTEEAQPQIDAKQAPDESNSDASPECDIAKKDKSKKLKHKKEKKVEKVEKVEEKKGKKEKREKGKKVTQLKEAEEDVEEEHLQPAEPSDDGQAEEATKPMPQSSPDSDPVSPTFDQSPNRDGAEAEQASMDTSDNGGNDGEGTKRKHIQVPDEEKMLVFREKLHAKLSQFREARGVGLNGKPVRSREDLIEARRLEQAKKKAHKKEQRRKAKEEEDRKREEALKAASVRSSPLGSMSPSVNENTNFSFGRVAFADGTQMSRDLTYVLKNDKKKGPSDPKTALAKLENQKAKIASLDDDKRKEVLEKETWLAARKRVEGDKVKDDETLLKKAIKRKEKAKEKSEKEWKVRAKGVDHAIKSKQHKREGNIRKRREEKVLGKLGKKKKSKANKKVKARPGFEGSFSLGGKK